MNAHLLLQVVNFITLFLALVLFPFYIKNIKTKAHKYGMYSIYLWFLHTFIFYFTIMTNKFPDIFNFINIKPIPMPIEWCSILIWQIIITLAVKEILKINYLKSRKL